MEKNRSCVGPDVMQWWKRSSCSRATAFVYCYPRNALFCRLQYANLKTVCALLFFLLALHQGRVILTAIHGRNSTVC